MTRVETGGGSISLRPLEPDGWPAVERLFGARGACGGCWCMHWRVEKGGKAWDVVKGEPNRRAFRALVTSGAVRAVIAFAGDEPVGWCCFGPREDFPRLARSRMVQNSGHPSAWVIACFFVRSGWRRRGVGGALLEVAGCEAMRRGAPAVEGYPVRPRKPAGMPAAFAWTGTVRMFEAAGYVATDVPEGARPIYLLAPEYA